MRKSDDYAGNQIRILLNDLKTAAHNAKVKAVERFQQYITQYEPDIADDTVDYLFSGVNEMSVGEGLLYYCGVNSGKHGGQLKRICAPCISLLRWIVTMETDDELGNIYYDRFVHQPVSELVKINFEKHITQQTEGGGGLPFGGGGKSRSGNQEDAFELLLILVNDHRNEDGYDEPVDAFDMLNGNKAAYDLFKKWAAKSGNDLVKQAVKIAKASRPLEVDTRPTRWDDVVFKCVPLQEGEEGAVEMIVDENVVPPIPDPLGVSDVDLRVTQEMYSSGRLFKTRGGYARRGTAWSAPSANVSSGGRKSGEFEAVHGGGSGGGGGANAGAEEDSEDEDSEEESVPLNITTGTPFHQQKTTKQMLSVIPSDKSFSTTLFLTLVHGSTSFLQLQKGVDHLNELLQQQSSRRVNLVRLHFGLFVQCADGLEWLKAFRNGVNMPKRGRRAPSIIDTIEASNNDAANKNNKGKAGGPNADKGMEKLKKAQVTLDHAKIEAQSTLAPILERMRNSRRVKSAEKVLRRMAGVLEHPYKMRQALDRGDLQEVVQIYQRVQAIPTTISLRILQRVKNVAESIMVEMKKQLTTALLTPSTDHRMLLRYCKILLDLDGTQAYLDILRQCIVRQILHFVDLIRETREKFAADAVDAHNKGLELNMMNKSTFYSSADRESITSSLRKYSIPSGRSIKRSASVRRSATGGGSFYVEASEHEDISSRHYSNDEFDDGDDDNQSEIDWLEEDSVNGDGDEGDWQAGGEGGSSRTKKDVDACLVLSGQVCQHYLEHVVDTMAKWFPCLMRLVSEFVIVQAAFNRKNNAAGGGGGGVAFNNAAASAAASAASSAPAPFLNSAMKGASRTLTRMPSTNVFGQTRPAPPPVTKLLGSALKLYTDFLRNVIHGLGAPFQSFLCSSDLVSAFGELDLKAITGNPNAPLLYATTSNAHNYLDPGIFDVLMSSTAFTSSLRDPHHRTVLREIYELYDGMESILTSDVAVNAHHARVHGEKGSATAGAGGPLGGGATSNVPFGGGKQLQFSSTSNAPSIGGGNSSELYFLQSSSPYCEAMTSLLMFSKEGEMDVAHKIMERLHTLTYKVCEYSSPRQEPATVGSTRSSIGGSGKSFRSEKGGVGGAGVISGGGGGIGGAGGVSGAGGTVIHHHHHHGGGGGKERNMLRLEQSVHDLETLVLKCLHKINSVIKRTDWVAQVVHDDMVKVMITFIDALRREGILIEDSKSGLMKSSMIDISSGGGNNSPSLKRSRKKSSSNAARASVSNGLIIQTLEEELKNGELIDKQKIDLLLDMLRACIRLRNFSLPMFRKQLVKMFPIPSSGQPGFDSPISGASPFSSNAASSGAAGVGSVGISDIASKPSLMNKLFAFESVPEVSKKSKNKSIHPSAENIASILAAAAKDKDDDEQDGEGGVISLADRLKASLCEDMGNLKSTLSEVVELEDKTVSRYLDQKKKEILNAVYAGYSLLCHRELSGKWKGPSGGIPSHLSRILLLVGHEKSSLYKELGKLTVEYGGRKTNASANVSGAATKKAAAGSKGGTHSLLAKYRAKSGNGAADEAAEHDSDLDYDDTLDEHDDIVSDVKKSWDAMDEYGPGVNVTAPKKETSTGLRYSDHIYYDLCCALLDTYAELIQKLKSNTFLQSTAGFEGTAGGLGNAGVSGLSSSRTSGSVGNCATINALSQAQEEHLYLQNILRPVLSTINANFAATHSTHNFKYANVSSKPLFLTADKLLEDSKLFTMLIAN